LTDNNVDSAIDRIRRRIDENLPPDRQDILLLIRELDRHRKTRQVGLETPEWWGKGTGD